MKLNKNGYLLIGGIAFSIVLYVVARVTTTPNNPQQTNVQNTIAQLNGSPAQNEQASQNANTALSGILVGTMTLSSVTLTAYDPTNGSVTSSRTFNTQGFNINRMRVGRSSFNKDYTELAIPESNSGSTTSIGYIDQAGNFTNLTPTNGYSDAQNQTDPYFDLSTGRIWFHTYGSNGEINGYGSVDPSIGPSSSRTEQPPKAIPNNVLDIASGIMSPDGKITVAEADTGGFTITNTQTGSATSVPASSGYESCKPHVFITDTSFLCFPNGAAGLGGEISQLFKVTVSPDLQSITTVALLPQSNRVISDATGSPSGTQVAFTSQLGSVITVYTISANGGGQPQKVTDLGGGGAQTLVGWK